jgi:hypothetical protein
MEWYDDPENYDPSGDRAGFTYEGPDGILVCSSCYQDELTFNAKVYWDRTGYVIDEVDEKEAYCYVCEKMVEVDQIRPEPEDYI